MNELSYDDVNIFIMGYCSVSYDLYIELNIFLIAYLMNGDYEHECHNVTSQDVRKFGLMFFELFKNFEKTLDSKSREVKIKGLTLCNKNLIDKIKKFRKSLNKRKKNSSLRSESVVNQFDKEEKESIISLENKSIISSHSVETQTDLISVIESNIDIETESNSKIETGSIAPTEIDSVVSIESKEVIILTPELLNDHAKRKIIYFDLTENQLKNWHKYNEDNFYGILEYKISEVLYENRFASPNRKIKLKKSRMANKDAERRLGLINRELCADPSYFFIKDNFKFYISLIIETLCYKDGYEPVFISDDKKHIENHIRRLSSVESFYFVINIVIKLSNHSDMISYRELVRDYCNNGSLFNIILKKSKELDCIIKFDTIPKEPTKPAKIMRKYRAPQNKFL